MTQLTILMPCLNEAVTLGHCIEQAQAWIARSGVDTEIVIADNGSTDGSSGIAESMGARVVHVAERGYGAALYAGCADARSPWIVFADADASYDFSAIDPYVAKLREGCDFVMGNRFAGGIAPGAMPWKNRHIGTPVLSLIGRVLFGVGVGDFNCGMRALTKDAFERMDLRTTGMEFASEMIVKAGHAHMRVAEVPTTLSKDGRDRPPHLRPWRDGWRHLRFMLLFSPRWLFWYPGICLMAVGIITGSVLVRGPLPLGRITLDVHTLLFAAVAVLIGFQATSFAVLSKFVATRAGLRRPEAGFEDWFRHVTLESGLVSGALLVAIGLALSLSAVSIWGGRGFGHLQPAETLRWVIPGALCLVLGCQMILTSFFLGVLRLDTHTDAA